MQSAFAFALNLELSILRFCLLATTPEPPMAPTTELENVISSSRGTALGFSYRGQV